MGMMLSGLLDVLFGIAYPLGIHSIWYLIFVQVVTGLVQVSLVLLVLACRMVTDWL